MGIEVKRNIDISNTHRVYTTVSLEPTNLHTEIDYNYNSKMMNITKT